MLSLVAGVALISAGLAFGQQWQPKSKTYIPFDFVVGDRVLSAGNYSVNMQVGHSSSQLMFRNVETGAGAFANNADVGTIKPTSYVESSILVFVLEPDGRHVLHQVWLPGDSHGHDLVHKAGLAEPR